MQNIKINNKNFLISSIQFKRNNKKEIYLTLNEVEDPSFFNFINKQINTQFSIIINNYTCNILLQKIIKNNEKNYVIIGEEQ